MNGLPAKGHGGHRGLAAMLAALVAVGPFSIDAYLPSMPEIGQVFEASPLLVQQTLTAYLAPFALMTLWHGAISDTFGRRRVTLVALALFGLASVGCTMAWNIESLLAFRIVQGMTAGAGMVVGRAIVRDVLEGAEAQRLMSRVILVFAAAPAVAPVLGGWLHVWIGWRAVFGFLVLYTATTWLWCWRSLPETLPRDQRQSLQPGYLARTYRRVLTTPAFVALSVAVTFNFTAVFLYIVSAPEFLLNQLRVAETEFLWLFGPATLGVVAGSWLSGRMAGRWSRGRTVGAGYAVMVAAAAGNVMLSLLVPPGVPWSVLPIMVYFAGSSLAMPSLTLMALDLFPAQRGMASSCQSFVQTTGNALVAGVVAPLVWSTTVTLALGEAAMLLVALAAFAWYQRSEARTCAVPA